MKELLLELEALGGVRHGCIIREGKMLVTTFPATLNEKMMIVARAAVRVFRGADSIQKGYNEIYFEMEDGYLLGYPLEGGFLVLLLAGKEVNFSLVHMTLQSAESQLSESTEHHPEDGGVFSDVRDSSSRESGNAKIDLSLKPVLGEILEALTLQIGPVAKIIMGEALKKWRQAFDPIEKNLPMLIQIIAREIDDESSRRAFLETLRGERPEPGSG